MGERSPAACNRGIARLHDRIADLRAFDLSTASNGNPPTLAGLQAGIADTLERIFGRNTPSYRRFQGAAHLMVPSQSGGFFTVRTPAEYYPAELGKNLERSIKLLEAAQDVLREDLTDSEHEMPSHKKPTLAEQLASDPRRVFVVHGHDGEARELIARFLERIGFEAVILNEQVNRNRTIIEKIEANSDVGFAVVLLTPDDVGRSGKEDELKPRVRQNVLLELGYFIGRLGREKVCALKRGDLEIPSDYFGVVWVEMDSNNGWKQALAKELEAAGHDIDWKKAMRS